MKEKTFLVDVIIPVYHPDEKFIELILMLKKQTYPIHKIIIMNTERDLLDTKNLEGDPGIEIHHITKEEFDHGGTRNQGAGYSKADLMVFMTQDAVPADSLLIENLVESFKQPEIAISYARQLPEKDCRILEAYTRTFNYPDQDMVKGVKDLKRLGIKTYFSSNACAAYRKTVYTELGGFIRNTIFNEDMIFAAGAVKAGYLIRYASKAMVVHSHNYSNMEQFRRNFDLAVSQKDHPEVFAGIKSEKEGINLVKRTAHYLIEQKKSYLIPDLVIKSGFKFLGYRFGKIYDKLPKSIVLFCTMNKSYWGRTNGKEKK